MADWEQYIAGCLNFDANEYFKRFLAKNSTIQMYMKLLSYYKTNDASVNHYAYHFMQRLCSFRLVQDLPSPDWPQKTQTLNAENLTAAGGIAAGTNAHNIGEGDLLLTSFSSFSSFYYCHYFHYFKYYLCTLRYSILY